MPFMTYRHRQGKYKQVCQHCQQEIKTRRTYVNFFYTLLCGKCFKVNAAPVVMGVQAMVVAQVGEG